MRNRWTTLLGILCVLFVVAVAFGQEQADTTPPNSKLSQSESVIIIKEIHAAELRTRAHIDKKTEELGDEISKLKTNVAVLDNEVRNLKWWLTVLTTLILIPLIFPGLKTAWQRLVKGGSTDSGHSPSFKYIQSFAHRSGFSDTSRSENRDSAEGS